MANRLQSDRYQLAGVVNNAAGEPMAGAYLVIKPGNKTVITDEKGHFSIKLQAGRYQLECQYLSMERYTKELRLNENTHLAITLKPRNLSLKQVEITANQTMDVNAVNMGSTFMDVKLLTKMPALLGEVDVIRSVSSLPGVVNAGEGTAGFYVRGGSADQNLILLDDVPVFNSSHLFGFFSVYNPDVLKSYTLHRSGISAKYGSRISSILDVRLREGNGEKMQYFAGISPVSARIGLEGPIGAKTTIIVSARGAYPKYLMQLFDSENIKKSSAHFYDGNVKINYNLNKNNSLSLSTYYSADGFKFPYDTTYSWSNKLGSLRWDHIFSARMSGSLSVAKSIYDNNIEGIATGEEFNLSSGIDFSQLKAELGYFGIKGHTIDFGGGVANYNIQPGKLRPYGTSSLNPLTLQRDKGSEYYGYLNDEITISDKLSLAVGLRYTHYVKKGPNDVYIYEAGIPKRETSIIDTVTYADGKTVQTYQGLEPRASLKYSLGANSSLKAGYSRTRQYIQLITNTAAITPVDVWKLSDAYIKPQVADQVALGYFHLLPDNRYEFSLELYYKMLRNQVDYKDGAVILLNKSLEADLLYGNGKAYGAEWLVKKNTGRLTGWLSFTYSRSYRTIKGNSEEETINHGDKYPSNYDKPVNLNIFTDYQLTPSWTLSANFNYTTGRPITAADSWFRYYGFTFSNYYGRNQERMPDYHRLDISFNHDFRKKKLTESSGSISVYNLYARKNAYSTLFRHYYGSPPGAYKLAIIGIPIPSVNYNIKF
ncbi:TonB-dependent receptor [Pontibacter vulgaris]|uniref:TonB-dependent receptor n=1 Tax=Pontibacter vulgaris TaxID=2905679 RepID=UPI001FA80DF1|nr:TonB-dependent receptor [Pontibacter vulgaris]